MVIWRGRVPRVLRPGAAGGVDDPDMGSAPRWEFPPSLLRVGVAPSVSAGERGPSVWPLGAQSHLSSGRTRRDRSPGRRYFYQGRDEVQVGTPEQEVCRRLGPPDATLRSLEELGPLPNSARPRRPVTHKAYLYYTCSAAMCFIHISEQGTVEWIFFAGS